MSQLIKRPAVKGITVERLILDGNARRPDAF